MNKTTEAFEAWWSDTGEQSLFALNTTTDDDIKILAGIAWEAAIREALAESKPAPDGRIPKTVFTIEDIGKAAEMGRQAGMIDALAEQSKCACDSCAWCTKYKKCNREMLGLPKAEPVKQEPVACQDSDDRRLLREIFMLCESTEEIEAANDFTRGRIFEAKGIRRAIGVWYQDTFCGRSYMGEPVIPAAPLDAKAIREERTKELMQLFLDPENQPTQFGTATLEYREEERKAIRDEALEDIAALPIPGEEK